MIDTSWGSIRILIAMILGVIWFYLFVQRGFSFFLRPFSYLHSIVERTEEGDDGDIFIVRK